MTVSAGAPHRPAKATQVSDNRTTYPARQGRSAAGRRRGLAGLRDGAPISDPAPLVRRAPEGPEGQGGLRDRPLRAKLACGDLAGGRARRRRENPWRRKHRRRSGGAASTGPTSQNSS